MAPEFKAMKKLPLSTSQMSVSPDTFTFNILIKMHGRKSEPKEASLVMDEMIRQGIHPDVVTWSSIMDAWRRAGKDNLLKLR